MQHVSYSIKITLLFFCCLTSFSLLTACEKSTKTKKLPTPTVEVVKAVETNFPLSKNYIGITQAISSVDIRARVKGFLIKKNFVEGTFVKKGQLLFEIDPTPFEAQLRQNQAELANAIAEANFQKVEFLRMKQLYSQQVISKEKFDQTSTSYKQSVAQIAEERAAVANAKINLSYCYMYSPIDGRIGKKYVSVGNLVGGTNDTLLATVVTLNPMYVEFSPSVADFGEFFKYKKKGEPFSVIPELPRYKNLQFKGYVDLINNQSDSKTGTVLMRASVENPDKLLIPGLYVNLKLILDKNHKAILIPEQAVMQGQDQSYVYVVNQEGIVSMKAVKSRTTIDNKRVIETGLKPNQLVIVTNLNKIKPGEKVNFKILHNENNTGVTKTKVGVTPNK